MPLDIGKFYGMHQTYGEKKYSPSELHELCAKSIEVLKKEPTLLKIDAPVAVAGNTYGCFDGVVRFCELYEIHTMAGGGKKKNLFIGNYSGAYTQSLETIASVLILKLFFPGEVFLLRGDCDYLATSRSNVHSIQQDLERRFGKEEKLKLISHFNEVFSWMPLAALVDGKIFCVNGGIPPQLKSLEEIQKISRPLLDPSTNSLAHYMLNAAPTWDSQGQEALLFNEDDVRKSLRMLGLSKIINAGDCYFGLKVAIDEKFYTIQSAFSTHENFGAGIFIDKEAFQPVSYQAHFVIYEGKNRQYYSPDPFRDRFAGGSKGAVKKG